MVHMYQLLHVVTYILYMTRIDYNALLTPLIAKACVVQWIECRTPDSRANESRRRQILFFLFIEKFTEYVQTFIYILARLSLCVMCI